jgi:serine/threonine protein kinase
LKKTGLTDQLAVEWLVDFKKLKMGEKVGQGASAQVFKGSYCGQTVAVKRLYPSTWEPELADFFQGEVRVLITLHHPNIVRLYGAAYNHGDGRCYIVTEFCAQGSIADLIQNKSEAVNRASFYDIALGICHGMGYLHSKPVVHRDLKPENVLLDGSNTVKLCDFGVSRIVGTDNTAMTGQIGTPSYMAPEMIEGKINVLGTTKVDVYSFAVVLWTMWTGEVPYKVLELTPFSLLSKIMNGLRPELPDDLPHGLRVLIEVGARPAR